MSNVKQEVEEADNKHLVAFTIRVDQKLFDELNAFTKKNDLTRSGFLRLAIRKTMRHYKKGK